MNEKKSRTLFFIGGVSIGLLVGATAVFMARPMTENKGEVSENMIEQIVNKVYSLVSSKRNEQDSLLVLQEQSAINSKNKTLKALKGNDKVANPELDSSTAASNTQAALNDSSRLDSNSAILASVNLIDEIVVKKDELLSTKIIDMLNMDYSSSSTLSAADSLLQLNSGIRDDSKMNEAKYFFQVELWKSPINYRGYKLAKNKLILFGIEKDAALKLIYLSENAYLKYAESYYKLDNYSDYKAFEKVSNPQLISQLNK